MNQTNSISKEYWQNVPASVDGMLGGFSDLHDDDVGVSKKILTKLFGKENQSSDKLAALDVGAGLFHVLLYFSSKFL